MKKNINLEKIKMNYQEMAFVSDQHSFKECKIIFQEILNTEKISPRDEVDIQKIKPYFGAARSMDPRYDGENLLILKLRLMPVSFLKFIDGMSIDTEGKFKRGKSIFYKILSDEHLKKLKELSTPFIKTKK